MPIYEFNNDFSSDFRQLPDQNLVSDNTGRINGIEQLEDVINKKVDVFNGFNDVYGAYVREDVPVAFHALENALKHYFSIFLCLLKIMFVLCRLGFLVVREPLCIGLSL